MSNLNKYDCGTCGRCVDRHLEGRILPLDKVCLYVGKPVSATYLKDNDDVKPPCGWGYYDGDYNPAKWIPKK